MNARVEGFSFVDRLLTEWSSGKNQFSKPGEKLFGVYRETELVAVGGLNQDAYLADEKVGRLRH